VRERYFSASTLSTSAGTSLVIEASDPVPYVATRPDPLTLYIDFRNVSVDGLASFAANAKDTVAQKATFDKMLALVPDVKTGSTLTFIYLPGKGTTLQVADKELGVFEGKGFADAVFSIWLGAKPPSEDLRKGMLG